MRSQNNRRRTPSKNRRRSEVANLDYFGKDYVHIPKTVKYDLHKQMQSSHYTRSLYKKIKPEEFNRKFYNEKGGLNSPLVFKCAPSRLGMKMVDGEFGYEQVAQMVGGNRTVPVTSDTNKGGIWMSLDDLVEYMKQAPHQRAEVNNSISLEFSNSALADHVSAPALVRELDWGSKWPDSAKFRSVWFQDDGTHSIQNHYPRAEHFCLITAAGAFTNFHVDFHGSSVWYHVKKGKKVFWIVSPTDHNLSAYERWERDPKETRFFGEVAEENTCSRVVLDAGTTLILPSGWIHAVSTPEDSLVFGGNFLHIRAATMQLRIKKQEDIIGIDKSARYQNEDEALLYFMNALVKTITGRQYIRPSSRSDPPSIADVDPSTVLYCGEAFTQEGRHKSSIESTDYETGGKALNPIAEDPTFDEYMKSGMEDARKPVKANGATDHQRVQQHFWDDLTFFHPKSWGMDQKSIKGTDLAKAVSKDEPDLEINQDALQEKIHLNDVPQLRRLIQYLHEKKSIVLPRGLTRPHSLIACLEVLLTKREEMNEVEVVHEGTPSTSSSITSQQIEPMQMNGTHEEDSEPPMKMVRVKREVEDEEIEDTMEKNHVDDAKEDEHDEEENEEQYDHMDERQNEEDEENKGVDVSIDQEETKDVLYGENYEDVVPAFEESDGVDEVEEVEADRFEEELQVDENRVEEKEDGREGNDDTTEANDGKETGEKEDERVDGDEEEENEDDDEKAPPITHKAKTATDFEIERKNGFATWLRVHKTYFASKYPEYDRRTRKGYNIDDRCRLAILIFKDVEQKEKDWWIDHGKEECSRYSKIAVVSTTRCDCWSPYCLLTLDQNDQ